MAIDLYAYCPCGSGKKVKFCCRDLAGEFEKIERMIEAGQRQACLDYILQLEKKFPNRTYLLTLKAELQRALGLIQEADGTVASLLQRQADNPVAWAESALQALQEAGGIATAIDRLQRALEVVDRVWPAKLLEALAAVSHHAIAEGELLAGYEHMLLYLAARRENQSALHAFSTFHSTREIPLLFKEGRQIITEAGPAPWAETFAQAVELALSARFRLALTLLAPLAEQVSDAPVVWYNLGLLRGYLADRTGAAEAFRHYAQLDVPLDDAVEAEALAQLLDPPADRRTCDVVSVPFTISDLPALVERLRADPRAIESYFEVREPGDGESPPPRHAFVILDRPPLTLAADVPLDAIPCVRANALIYGRQTDREPRLELLCHRDDGFPSMLGQLAEMSGPLLGPAGDAEIIGQAPLYELQLESRWWFPIDTPRDVAEKLGQRFRSELQIQRWKKLPHPRFDDRTPLEAAKDPRYRIPLLGWVLNLELLSNGGRISQLDFNDLRRELGLPEATPIDPQGVDVAKVPLVRLHRLPTDALSDDQLTVLLNRALTHHATQAAYHAALEVVSRSSLADRIDRGAVYALLSHLAETSSEALEFLDRGRRLAESQRQPTVRFDLEELNFRLERGEGTEAERMLQRITSRHGGDPSVRSALRQIMYRHGLIQPDGTPVAPSQPAIVTPGGATAEPGKIWTPGGEQPSAGEPPKIWVPS
jgi:hypothetical protein